MGEAIQAIMAVPIPFNFLTMMVIFGGLSGMVAVVAAEARKYAAHRADLDFKREMVEQGMSADEIERVVRVRVEKKGTGEESADA